MSLDLSWDALAVLKGGMRIHYSGADPSGDSGCPQLFSGVVVFDWNKQTASARLWMLSHISVIVSESSQLGAPKSDLPVGTAGMYQGSLT